MWTVSVILMTTRPMYCSYKQHDQGHHYQNSRIMILGTLAKSERLPISMHFPQQLC